MSEIHDALAAMELPPATCAPCPDSPLRFPDGAHYRDRDPQHRGTRLPARRCSRPAARLDVPVHRVSQGSGVFMLTDAELDDMAAWPREARVEVSLFARPNAGWDASATARARRPADAGRAPRAARTQVVQRPRGHRAAPPTTASAAC